MKIIRSKSEKITVKEKYLMSMNPEIRRMRDAEGMNVPVLNWMIYSEKDKEGNEQILLSILSEDNVAYATNSRTFIEAFSVLCDMFADSGEEIAAIKVIGGQSKTGRHYITCAYAE
nr:MAG TPA: ssDNA binding protein [Caudoviricetes sp.]